MYNAYLCGTTIYRIPEYRENGVIFHYGIEGMHWGVRRFQNEDGSVKPAGAQRYYSEYGDNYKRSDDPKNKPGAVPKDKKDGESGKKKGLSDKTKKRLKTAAKIGAASVVAAAAAYTIYKGAKEYKGVADRIAKEYANSLEKDSSKYAKSMAEGFNAQRAQRGQEAFSKSVERQHKKRWKQDYISRNKEGYKKKAKEVARKEFIDSKTKKIRNKIRNSNSFSREFDRF